MPSNQSMNRRRFLEVTAASAALTAGATRSSAAEKPAQPNVVFIFADQWRAQATGYAGDPNVKTPHIDALAKESLNFRKAVSGCPVCTPYRAALLTGQYWLTNGMFMNDICLPDKAVSIAEAYDAAGYDTGYIGKWHLDGHGRTAFIPRERRQGFDFWKVLECTHNYNDSPYYADKNEKLKWDGYDAIEQSEEAQRYIREHAQAEKPFFLMLSWGPPHNPYQTAPEKYQAMYDPAKIILRGNVPKEKEAQARKELAGYYAHCSALDDCVGDILKTMDEAGVAEDTIFVFTSDHGDMLHSLGEMRKQRPYEESLRVPFLLRYPRGLGKEGRDLDTLINTPDIMPTLLGMSGAAIPETVEGEDFSGKLLRGETPEVDAAYCCCIQPFGEWARKRHGREYRGIRTDRYTYVRDLSGPWLLFDNDRDYFQQNNLVGNPDAAKLQQQLDKKLMKVLKERDDEFLSGEKYLAKWGHEVNQDGTVPYKP